MKKQRKNLWFFSLFCMLGFFSIGIGCKKEQTITLSDFIGFEVVNEVTVEIGQYYVPEVPTVTLNGNTVSVYMEAKRGEEDLYFNGDNALLVDGFEDIKIIYTVFEQGVTVEKSTLLKVQDTVEPYIVVSRLPEKIYRGEMFNYMEYIRVGDLSGVCDFTVDVTDSFGNAISTKDGTIALNEDSIVQAINFMIRATDSKNNTAQKTVTVPVKDLPYYTNPFDFETIDVSKVTSQFSGTVVEETKKDGKNAVKISANLEWKNETLWSVAHFTLPQNLSDFVFYDYMKVTASADTNVDLIVYGVGCGFKAGDSSVKEMIYDTSLIKGLDQSVIRDEKYRVNIAILCARPYETVPENVEMDFYVYDIEFGFYDDKIREVANDTPIDLSWLNLTEEDMLSVSFMPNGGVEEAIDIVNFIPSQSGRLTLTVKKRGYRTTVLTLGIKPVQSHIEEGNDKDTDIGFIW